jgi:hypothetical protein
LPNAFQSAGIIIITIQIAAGKQRRAHDKA